MTKVKTFNNISEKGLSLFDMNEYSVSADYAEYDAALVRSAVLHDVEFPSSLLAIARAGAGVNNIPLDDCAKKGICVFNTPGANANAVKELAVAGLLLASRDIVGGINWVKTIKEDPDVAKLVEKGKSKFAGQEILGKKLGIIGLGAIGGPLANAAVSLGMDVYGCDPYLSVDGAWKLSRSVHHVKTRYEIFANCDYISVHTPLVDNPDPSINTKKMINRETLAMMKDGVIILNFARDLLVDDDAMAEAIASGKVKKYVTDFPNTKTAGMDGVIAIPHLGASTEESEENCAVMAVNEIKTFIETGNIINSVNLPNCELAYTGRQRITVIHANVPNIVSQLTQAFSKYNINIDSMANKSKGEFAYTIIDIDNDIHEDIEGILGTIDGVIKVRII